MDYLCECSTDRDRRATLQKLPPNLPSSYEQILERVNRSTKENQTLVKNTLNWIVYAEQPLTAKQLLQALAVHDDDTYFDESAMTTEEEILHWCSSLVRKNPSEPTLELAHFTVKEFLFTIDPLGNSRFLQYRLSGGHSVLAKSCINFLKCENLFDLSPLELEFQEASSQEHSKSDCGANGSANNARLKAFWATASFTNEYDFIGYASTYWNYHVHHSDWEAVEKSVLNLFLPSFNKISLWTFAYVCFRDHRVPPEHFQYKFLKEPGRPRALHWAAGFAFDKVCKILIQNGAEVNQASRFGTPLYCSLAWSMVSTLTPVLELESLDSRLRPLTGGYARERDSTVRLLLNAGADVGAPIAADNPNKPVDVTMAVQLYHLNPTSTFILLDAGAKLSTTSLRFCSLQLEWMGEPDVEWLKGDYSNVILKLVGRVLARDEACLDPDAHGSFFAYIIDVIISGCPILADMLSCFETSRSFRKMLTPWGIEEFNDLLNKGKENGNLRTDLVKFLSKSIRFSSKDQQEALLHLQKLLSRATTEWQAWVVTSLIDLNPDLDFPLDADGNTLLDSLLDFGAYRNTIYNDKWKSTIKALISHGANVIQKNQRGMSAIEKAADWRMCDAATFRLFWDSAQRTESADFMCTLGETVFSRALSSKNVEVSEFLAQKLGRKFEILRRNSLPESSNQGNSPDHVQRLPLSDSVSSGSVEAPEGTSDWRSGEGEGPDSLSESRDTEESHISVKTMTPNIGVHEPAPLTSTNPIIFELSQIYSTQIAQSDLTPSRSQEDLTSECNQAASGLAPVPRYLVWQHPIQETFEIDENQPAIFLLLDEDSKPVLEGILRRA
jgi:hypothetical protein